MVGHHVDHNITVPFQSAQTIQSSLSFRFVFIVSSSLFGFISIFLGCWFVFVCSFLVGIAGCHFFLVDLMPDWLRPVFVFGGTANLGYQYESLFVRV